MTHIDTIIFDYGGVLAKYGFLQNALFDNENDTNNWFNHMSPSFKKAFNGEISFDDFCNISAEFTKEEKNSHRSKLHNYILEPNNDVINLLKKLKSQNYKILILTNNLSGIVKEFIQINNLSNFIDGIFDSSEIKMVKPEKLIYEHMIKKESLIPKNCLFIDDSPSFVKAAEKLQIESILFTNYSDLMSNLTLKDIIK